MPGMWLVLYVLAALNTGADTEQVRLQRGGKYAFGGATQMEHSMAWWTRPTWPLPDLLLDTNHDHCAMGHARG